MCCWEFAFCDVKTVYNKGGGTLFLSGFSVKFHLNSDELRVEAKRRGEKRRGEAAVRREGNDGETTALALSLSLSLSSVWRLHHRAVPTICNPVCSI
ncbi:hypothetical protein LOK49_LG01G03848 [Camellia lanceoleosa]|uniref:Uncharacterized protein n=1 Tax=Camellia lanceoleosa TaxID=1840588 RepID=A0ACC0IXV3_9ERIC|nr:hypothetical protein LOK49_LG01G03848 [Camellia lanceoleosa]